MRQQADRCGIEQLERCFLPNFCEVRMVFAVVVIAELLALILTLARPGVLDDPWGSLAMTSMFMQWIALTSAAVLCLVRPLLSRLGNTAAALIISIRQEMDDHVGSQDEEMANTKRRSAMNDLY